MISFKNADAPAQWYYVTGQRVLVYANNAASAAKHFMNRYGQTTNYRIQTRDEDTTAIMVQDQFEYSVTPADAPPAVTAPLYGATVPTNVPRAMTEEVFARAISRNLQEDCHDQRILDEITINYDRLTENQLSSWVQCLRNMM